MREILITGADGYLGRRLCAELVAAHPDMTLRCWMRASDDAQLAAKRASLMREIPAGGTSRLTCHGGDLRDDTPFAGVPAGSIEGIVHSAAIIRFNVEPELADAVNIGGTRKLTDFARQCPKLSRLVYLSSMYATGEQAGALREDDVAAPPSFANHYERTKYAAEESLRATSPVEPTVVRIPTLIADDADGQVSQFNVFHNTLRLLYNGLISVLPGNPDTPVYLATRADAVAALRVILTDGNAGTYHACPDADHAARLQQIIDDAFKVFREHSGFAGKRILPPRLADAATFNVLASAMTSLSRGMVADALDSIVPFARQLYVTKSVENGRMATLAPHLFRTDPRQLVSATTRWLTRTRWGHLDG